MSKREKNGVAAAVSVVLPNHNHVQYLETTITSLLNQSLAPAEIIVVDDASTDDSWQLIERLAEEHCEIITIKRERNGGVNAALGDGLSRARSPFVFMASADDIYLPDLLRHSVEMLSSHPQAALVFSDPAELIDKTGEKKVYPRFIAPQRAYYRPDMFAAMLRRSSFTPSSNTTVFRREWLTAIGGFAPTHPWHADWLAIMRLGLSHGVCYLPEVLSYFRVREDSYSHKNLKRTKGQAQIIAECLKTIYESSDDDLIARFRYAALMPQHDVFMFPRLLTYRAFRKHVTPKLVGWVFVRHLWSFLRPLTPPSLRKRLRRALNTNEAA